MKKIIIYSLLALAFVAGIIIWQKYNAVYVSNVPANLDNEFLDVYTGSSFDELVEQLVEGDFILDTASFRETAELMSFSTKPEMRPGRYKVKAGWSNADLIRHLRSGKRETVKVVLTTERMPENVAAKVARFLEQDSAAFVSLLNDETYIESLGYTKETLQTLFIPNTYDMYWNTSPKAFIERMVKEHNRFWSKDNRRKKAEALKMTPAEVYTLASIIEKETNYKPERPRMAGVYLNRLERGIALQADPTCVFARKDFNTRRVTDYHTHFDSPYNTYMYTGLPPGPIAMSSISSIDAVLNAEEHNYIFFCAFGDGTGKHAYAKTLAGHNQNARRYRQNLKKRGRR